MIDKPGAKRPFIASHFRKSDRLPAMVLGEHGGNVLYRVQWTESGKRHENTLVRAAAVFAEQYRAVIQGGSQAA